MLEPADLAEARGWAQDDIVPAGARELFGQMADELERLRDALDRIKNRDTSLDQEDRHAGRIPICDECCSVEISAGALAGEPAARGVVDA